MGYCLRHKGMSVCLILNNKFNTFNSYFYLLWWKMFLGEWIEILTLELTVCETLNSFFYFKKLQENQSSCKQSWGYVISSNISNITKTDVTRIRFIPWSCQIIDSHLSDGYWHFASLVSVKWRTCPSKMKYWRFN